MTLPPGSSPEQLGLSGKLSEGGAEQAPDLSRQFRPNRQLPHEGRTAQAFFSLYFKLSVFHASFWLKMCWVAFAFNPLSPHLFLNVSLCVPSPPRCLLLLGHPINNFMVLFHSLLPLVPVCDGWLFRLLEAGAPTGVGGCGSGVGSGTHGRSLGCPEVRLLSRSAGIRTFASLHLP